MEIKFSCMFKKMGVALRENLKEGSFSDSLQSHEISKHFLYLHVS